MSVDTIAAVASAISNSGIGIIRVSGKEAKYIVNKIFITKSGKHSLCDFKSHTLHYGFIISDNDIIDEVMISFMQAPNSYTTEDVVEINCHGGVLIVNKILELVLKNGARLAEPGEFTKRAFLNGRIDLAKAEAVMDVIQSKNDYALKSSINQLTGVVSSAISRLRSDIIYNIAFIESALDDPEHISLEGYHDELSAKVDIILSELSKLIQSCEDGKIIKEGINTVIVGKPNVGKSSLLNLLIGEERAIVTDIPGTTRDILTESVKIGGIALNVIDTAGIRYTDDIIEKIGVDKAKKYALDADLVIYIVDSSVSLDQNDVEIIDIIKDKKTIILLNKNDLKTKVDEEEIKEKFNADNMPFIIKTSTKENTGFDQFEKVVYELFMEGKIDFEEEIFITNLRHKEALQNAYNDMFLVRKSLNDDMPEDFYTIDLMSAYKYLGFIIGEEVEEDLVNEIFTKFCMGK